MCESGCVCVQEYSVQIVVCVDLQVCICERSLGVGGACVDLCVHICVSVYGLCDLGRVYLCATHVL